MCLCIDFNTSLSKIGSETIFSVSKFILPAISSCVTQFVVRLESVNSLVCSMFSALEEVVDTIALKSSR